MLSSTATFLKFGEDNLLPSVFTLLFTYSSEFILNKVICHQIFIQTLYI